MKQKYWAMIACSGMSFWQANAAVSDPADASTITPPTIYQSPFTDYRPLGENKNTAWKDANDTVGKIGGWRVYAREAADAMKATAATKASPDGSKPAGSPPLPAKSPTTPTSPTQPHKHGG